MNNMLDLVHPSLVEVFFMPNIIYAILIAFAMTACSSAPVPKQPYQGDKIPVNKTLPTEAGEI